MRATGLFAVFFLALSSCQVEGELTSNRNTDVISSTAVLQSEGAFVPTSGISVSGFAQIYLERGQYKVNLRDFDVSSGPDLKVYLSKASTPSQFVNLGNLTAQRVYPIPLGVDVAAYSHVLIHCQQYNHLFAIANLNEN